jgi:hypothetical protein
VDRSVVTKWTLVSLAMLAAGIFTFTIGVAGAMFAMRSAVGNYDFRDAVFGLSPANLDYSVKNGIWSGGFGIAVLLMSYLVCLQSKLHRGVAIVVSLGIALTAVIASLCFKWFSWAAEASV